MVGGQLHDKGGGLAGKGLELLQHDAGDDDRRHADEVGGGSHPGGVAEDGAGEQADDGHLGAAGDEAGGHDGHFAVPVLLDGAGGHDAGHAAAGSHQHGDEALAGQAEAAEDAVHDEGDAGHVAHVLQNGQQEEQDQHLGHEAQHRRPRRPRCRPWIRPYSQSASHSSPAGGEQDAVKEAGHPLTEDRVVGEVSGDGADGDGPAAHGDGSRSETSLPRRWAGPGCGWSRSGRSCRRRSGCAWGPSSSRPCRPQR